jgi:hypothetical protein
MLTTDIKNLSITLEALSRIPRVEDLALRIQSLLDEAIAKTEEPEIEKRRVREPPFDFYPAPAPPPVASIQDDNVPF